MRYSYRRCSLFLSLGLLVSRLSAEDRIASHNRPTQLNDPVTSYVLMNGTLHEAFSGRPWAKMLNIGWIYYDHPENEFEQMKRFSLSLASTTVRGILDALTAEETNYYWIADGDVVNFIPRVRGPSGLDMASLLERKISSIVISNAMIEDSFSTLLQKARLEGYDEFKAMGSTWSTKRYDQGGWIPKYEHKFSLSLENKSVRECFNRIVSLDPVSSWTAFPIPGHILIYAYAGSKDHGHTWRKERKIKSPTREQLDSIKGLNEQRRKLHQKWDEKGLTEEELELWNKLNEEHGRFWKKFDPEE